MIHNPEHRIAKMMRELKSFDDYVHYWKSSRKMWFLIVGVGWDNRDHIGHSQKPERCVRQALKQVRKIRGKR